MRTGDAASAARSDGWGSGQGACGQRGAYVTLMADIIACAVSASSHSAAALSACHISALPWKAGSVSQNSSRFDLSCPMVIGVSELHTGAFRQRSLFPGPGAARSHTRARRTLSAAFLGLGAPGRHGRSMLRREGCGVAGGGGRAPSGAPRPAARPARPRPRSPAAALALCASAASSLTDGLKQHAPMAPAEPHAAGAAARGRAPTVCWGAVARLPLKPGALPPPSQAPAAPTFGLFALEAPGGLRPSPLQQEATKKALADSSADGGDAAGRSQQLCKQPLALAASHPGCCRLQQ